jgi:hypothetical protein
MTDDYQIEIPPSFIALFVPPGRIKPTASRDHIAARYGFCEDLATMLTETAKAMEFRLGIGEREVLERVERGLRVEEAGVEAAEGRWVLRRLAELLGWPDPGPEGAGAARADDDVAEDGEGGPADEDPAR